VRSRLRDKLADDWLRYVAITIVVAMALLLILLVLLVLHLPTKWD
jgi:hypothetical protein